MHRKTAISCRARRAGTANPSKALCKCVHARLVLLSATLSGLRGYVAAHGEQLYSLAASVSQIADPMVIAAAVQGVFIMLPSLLSIPRVNFTELYSHSDVAEAESAAHAAAGGDGEGQEPSLGLPGTVNNAVARWVAKDGAGARRLPWAVPTPSDVAAARALLERAMRDMRAEIDAMIADGSIADAGHTPRLRLRRALNFISCVQTCLGHITPRDAARDDAIDLRDELDFAVDSIAVAAMAQGGWEGCTLAHDAIEAALLVAAHADAGNTWALGMSVHILQVRLLAHPMHVLCLLIPAQDTHAACEATGCRTYIAEPSRLHSHMKSDTWHAVSAVVGRRAARAGTSRCAPPRTLARAQSSASASSTSPAPLTCCSAQTPARSAATTASHTGSRKRSSRTACTTGSRSRRRACGRLRASRSSRLRSCIRCCCAPQVRRALRLQSLCTAVG
jgi:hypothetical protein